MISDITLGQFFPGYSVLHKLDPRTKLILTFLYIIALFVVNSFTAYAFMALVLGISGFTTNKVGEINPDSPAAQAGLLAGDEILAINGKLP